VLNIILLYILSRNYYIGVVVRLSEKKKYISFMINQISRSIYLILLYDGINIYNIICYVYTNISYIVIYAWTETRVMNFFSIIQRHVFARPFYCGYVYNMLLLYIDYTTYLHPTCKYIIILEKRDANVSIIPYNMGLVEIFVLKKYLGLRSCLRSEFQPISIILFRTRGQIYNVIQNDSLRTCTSHVFINKAILFKIWFLEF